MTLTPEIELLLDCTVVRPDNERVLRIRQRVERGVDWIALLRLAIPHGVLPLLTRNLSLHAADLAPAATLRQLAAFAQKAAERSRLQSRELVHLIAALSLEGIRALPFKGPALAVLAYGDVVLRESHDLDLWVEPAQFARAVAWFRDRGYQPINHVQGVPVQTANLQRIQTEFATPDGKVLIELHDQLQDAHYSFDPEFDQVWERRGRVTMDGCEVPVFALEDLVPALAVHGSKHMWRRLNWIVDLAAIISRSGDVDWEEVISRSDAWKCRRRLLSGLALASSLYGVELPLACRKAIRRQPGVRGIVDRVGSALFQQRQARTIRGFSAEVLHHLRSCDTHTERRRIVSHTLRRVAKADESKIVSPLSGNIRRIYSAVVAGRSWLDRARRLASR